MWGIGGDAGIEGQMSTRGASHDANVIGVNVESVCVGSQPLQGIYHITACGRMLVYRALTKINGSHDKASGRKGSIAELVQGPILMGPRSTVHI
eukprot:scaffold636119_cov389-Attheya_sp.AAC.1